MADTTTTTTTNTTTTTTAAVTTTTAAATTTITITTADIDVVEWPCEPPNVTIGAGFIDPSCPFTVEGKDGFMVNASFSVDCMKSEAFIAHWELRASNQALLKTLTNATRLVSEPYALPAGLYQVIVTTSDQQQQ